MEFHIIEKNGASIEMYYYPVYNNVVRADSPFGPAYGQELIDIEVVKVIEVLDTGNVKELAEEDVYNYITHNELIEELS